MTSRPLSPERQPVSGNQLARDLRALGVDSGQTLMVHSSLSAVGWVIGGAPTVVRALLDALGPEGTLAMSAASPFCGDPAGWSGNPVPERWLPRVRGHLPVFDPLTTPTTLGAIPECFRTWPGTHRSDHPLESVCAHGPLAASLTEHHALAFSEGLGTPYEALYRHQAQILLLGVGFNRCTALHFAESLTPRRRVGTCRFPLERDGRRAWLEVPEMGHDNDTHFPRVGERFLATGEARQGRIGEASSLFFPMPQLVDFARSYFEEQLCPT